MRTAVVHAAAGSLLLTTLAVAPTGSATAAPAAAAPDAPGATELRGTAVA
ncbi:hypothetical protein JL475_21535, partial [Streptomyces sp. M2CJ-2]|nr:hypothetical protein [Streptomyces sp. M2CJ-2]